MATALKKDALNHMVGLFNQPPIKQKDCIDLLTGQTSKDLQDAWNRWAGTTSNPRTINECAKIVAGLTAETVNTQGCLNLMNPIAPYSDYVKVNLWLDATYGTYTDAGATLATNGQSIQQWKSKAGSLTAIQNTAASRPVFFSSVLNSKPALFFDGTDDSMSFTQITTSNKYIIAYVASGGDATDGSNILSFSSSNAWYMRANVTGSEGVVTNVATNISTASGEINTAHLGMFKSVPSGPNGATTYYNNTASSTATAASFVTDGIGAAAADSPTFLPSGFYHEIMVIEGINTTTPNSIHDAVFEDIKRYLSKKWGLGLV